MNLSEAETLALSLMAQHGLTSTAWAFRFDNAKQRFGRCNYTTRTISLSRLLVALNNEEEVKDVILHEIAHALAPRNAHHGPVWKAIAKQVGARGERCYSSEACAPPAPYKAICATCGEIHKRYRLSSIRHACSACCRRYNHGRFSERFLLTFVNIT